jgi:leucyl-tRNA synthetase
MKAWEMEKKWQDRWQKDGIFVPQLLPGKEKFFMAIPYPYASGPLHIGHGRTYCNADVMFRYQKMKGKNAIWPMAYHITGTPILAVSAKIEAGDEKAINLYRTYLRLYESDEKRIDDIIESFKDPENVAKYFSGVISGDFKTLGLSIDWTRQFTTGDNDYNTYIDWQFRKLKELGFLTTGDYPILYCLNCKNAVGEDDIKSGDTIDPEVSEYTAMKFRYKDSFFVASTFRPETIFGVTNLWLHPDREYVKVNLGSEKWIISKEAVSKLRLQKKNVEELESFKGVDFEGELVETPIGRKVPVLIGEFVDPSEASGVVYSVPAHAPFDWMALSDLKKEGKAKGVEPISIIDVPGFGEYPAIEICKKMNIKSQHDEKLEEATNTIYKAEFYKGTLKDNCKEFKGKKVEKAKDFVVEFLKKKGFSDSFYEVSAKEKPVRCRCGGEIVVAVLSDQWFLDYGIEGWKEKATKHLSNMTIEPSLYRKFFEDTFSWVGKRPCARRRGLGTPLPFNKEWIIESLSDSTIYPAFYIFKKIIDEEGIKPKQLSFGFYDFIISEKGDIKEISKETGIEEDALKRFKDELSYWYPVDLRHTGIAHISNHLTFYIFNHVALFDKKYWPKAITLNDMLIREGKKMSKSLGNVIPLVEIPKRYSADLFRLYSVYGAELSSTLDFREEDIRNVEKKLYRWRGLIEKSKDKNPIENRYLESKFQSTIKKAEGCLETYKLREYVQTVFFDLLNCVNEVIRKEGDLGVVRRISDDWIKLMTPIVPHLCEELWHMEHDTYVSAESWPEFDDSLIDEKTEFSYEFTKEVLSDMKEIEKLVGKPKEIYLFTPESWKYELFSMLGKLRGKSLDETISEIMKTELRKRKVMPIIQKVKKDPSKLPLFLLGKDEEEEILRKELDFLSSEMEVRVLLNPDQDPKNKKRSAEPGKPAIYFEMD